MRGKPSFVLGAALAVLTTAGGAAAANGGLTPPDAHSPMAQRINTAYWVIAVFTGIIFVVVEGALVAFVVKYRRGRRPRDEEGAQVHGHTRLELIWTVIPVIIIAIIGAVVFYELPGITGPPAQAAAPIRIDINAHQFYWQFTYPNGAKSIDVLHLPVGQTAVFTIRTQDVNHSWWIPEFGGKTDAIAGKVNHTWYKPDTKGVFVGQCTEFCGVFHERMLQSVVVEDQAAYDRFVGTQWKQDLGRAEWQGVCAKCHGMQGQGGYGPALSSNLLLTQPAGLETIVRSGRLRMPAVGNDWTPEQMRALIDYVSKNIYKGARASGG